MAISIRGGSPLVVTSATGAAAISGTVTGTRQPQTGDVLIIIHCNDYYTAAAMPSVTVGGSTTGVTLLATEDAGTNLAHAKAYRYTAASTADLTVAVTETGAADEEKALIVYVLAGVNTTTVIDGTPAGSSGANSASFVAPAITTTNANSYLICHGNSGGGTNVTSFTPPSGMTETYDVPIGSAMGVTGAVLQLSASGSTGTKTFTAAGPAPWGTLSVAVVTASSGTAYTSTVNDTTGVTDSAAAAAGDGRAQDDPAGLVDSAATAMIGGRAQDDPAGLVDTATTAMVDGRSQDDQTGLVDSVTAALGHTASQSDDAGLTDGVAGALALDVTFTDPAGSVDTATTAMAGTRTRDDPAGLTDSAATVSAFTRTVNDLAGLADLASSSADRTASDGAGLSDAGGAQDRSVQGVDGAGLSDTVSPVLTFTRTADDPAGLSDGAAAASVLARAQNDPAGLADTPAADLTSGGSTAYTRTVGDLCGLADAGTGRSVMAAYTDLAGLSDTAAPAFASAVTDSTGLSDSLSSALAGAGSTRTVNEVVGLSDTGLSQARSSVGVDQVGLADSVSADLNLSVLDNVTVGDLVGLGDAGLSQTHFCRGVYTVGLTDTVSVALTLTRSIVDQVGLADLGRPQAVDVAEFQDEPAGLTDTLVIASGTTRTVLLTDPVGLLDSKFAVQTSSAELLLIATTALTASGGGGQSLAATLNASAVLLVHAGQQISGATVAMSAATELTAEAGALNAIVAYPSWISVRYPLAVITRTGLVPAITRTI